MMIPSADSLRQPPAAGAAVRRLRLAAFLAAATAVILAPPAASAAQGGPAAPRTSEAAAGDLSAAVGRPLRIGFIELEEDPQVTAIFDETLAALRQAFAPRAVEAQEMSSSEIERAVRMGELDAYISSSGFHWRMLPYGIRSVATLIESRRPDPNQSLGAVFLVKADRQDLQTLRDLKGRVLSASYPSAFVGYRIGMAEIAALPYEDWERYFSRTIFAGGPDVPAVLKRLDDGEADAALIRACWLEANGIALEGRWRILNEQRDALACRHSTKAYPGWMLAATSAASPADAAVITRTLFSLQAPDGSPLWGMSTDLRLVDRLYRLMRLGPYAYLREWSVERWLDAYWPLLLAAAGLVLLLALRGWRSERLLRRRTVELYEAKASAGRLREELEAFQKSGIVSQLSSMIAHDLNQPLAAISFYAQGLRTIAREDSPPKALLEESCRGIEEEAKRAGAIVQAVRSYAAGQAADRSGAESAAELAERIARAARASFPDAAVRVDEASLRGLYVRGNRLELELMLWNLVKNAVRASAGHGGWTTIRAHADGGSGTVHLLIENPGPLLSQADAARMALPLERLRSRQAGSGSGTRRPGARPPDSRLHCGKLRRRHFALAEKRRSGRRASRRRPPRSDRAACVGGCERKSGVAFRRRRWTRLTARRRSCASWTTTRACGAPFPSCSAAAAGPSSATTARRSSSRSTRPRSPAACFSTSACRR